MRFAKAHGLGNDFILILAESCPPDAAAWARRLCGRHEGIGGDGVIAFALGSGAARMRLFNADGTDGEISGNGLRCLAAYVVFREWLPERHVIVTSAGPREVEVHPLGNGRFRVMSDLGDPRLESRNIPMLLEPPLPVVVDHPIEIPGKTVRVTATSLGNPHCAVFVEEVASDDLVTSLGPALCSHPLFPNRTNVEFVTVVSRRELRVRFWERGVGLTRASGTGSASAAVAAILKGLTERRVRIVCDGGVLEVEWSEGGGVAQQGDVELLFEGEWLPSAPGETLA